MTSRRLLTSLVVTTIDGQLTQPVGDHAAPVTGGWVDEEGIGDFIPYVVVTALASSSMSGPLGNTEGDVVFPYALTSVGVTREQVEWMADEARDAAKVLSQTATSDGRTIMYAQVASYGATERIGTSEPAFYVVTDVVNLLTTA